MRKGRVTTIVLFVVLALLLLAYFIFINKNGKHFQWYENYRADNDQPYGLKFMKDLLKDYHPNGRFTFNSKKSLHVLLDSADRTNSSYVFIGESIHLSDKDQEALVNFMQAGNDVFIASLDVPHELIKRVHESPCDVELNFVGNFNPSTNFNFYHDTLRTTAGYDYAFRIGYEDRPYYWMALDSTIFCDSTINITPLGNKGNGQVNFAKISGKGNLYIHTSPIVFTNYFVTKEAGIEYAGKVFSHLHGDNIIWDEFSKVPFINTNDSYNTPLYFILAQPSLKYAWWLMIAGVLLYVLFVAKRTQRVIPVLEKKTNTSLEFVNLVSTLHFQNSNHLDMARKKMKYFLYFIRSKYGVHAQTFQDEQILRLAEKSKVAVGDVRNIFNQYNSIEQVSYYNIDANTLITFYYAIENFYKHCK